MSLQAMANIVETSDQFKDNCNLVNIDLLLRQGVIDQSHPEYQAITDTLYLKNNALSN